VRLGLGRMGKAMVEQVGKPVSQSAEATSSIADLFLDASRELAQSDARIYRSVGRHLARTKAILEREGRALDQERFLDDPDNPIACPPSFERQTRNSLESLCRLHGIRGYSRMSKGLMIEALKAIGVPPPSVPFEALSKRELIALLQQTRFAR
jgi:hypothetical protein